ncbi:MAG: RNA pyrophosphohydrolase [Alphaproteobacteria bacterium]|nr:RNA pyrophosphohydrolase [Alphaproteobacteria bacterium]
MSEQLGYRPCVGMMILNRRGQVLVGARIDNPDDAWQMPQGGIDDGEDPKIAAIRELEEEIGTTKVDVVAETSDWLHYDLPPDLQGKMWGGKYRGQKQKWFVMRFNGMDEDINIETEDPEFRDWKWVEIEQLPDLIVPFKRQLYERLVARFRHLTIVT